MPRNETHVKQLFFHFETETKRNETTRDMKTKFSMFSVALFVIRSCSHVIHSPALHHIWNMLGFLLLLLSSSLDIFEI